MLGLDDLYRLYIIIWTSAQWSTPNGSIIFVSPSTSWKYRGQSSLSSVRYFYFLPLSLSKEWNLEEERSWAPTAQDASALCSATRAGTAASKISLLPAHSSSVSGCISCISEILPRLFVGSSIQGQRSKICLGFSPFFCKWLC